MKRVFISTVLALALVLTVGAPSLAAPQGSGEMVSFFVFGEYSPLLIASPDNGFTLGGGFALTDNINAGLEVQLGEGVTSYGGFANLGFGPMAVSAEVLTSEGEVAGKVTGLFLFDVKLTELGVGAGVYADNDGNTGVLVAAKARAGLGSISLYGGVDYYLVNPFPAPTFFTAGVIYAF